MKRSRSPEKGSIFPIKVAELKKILQDQFNNNPDLSFSIYEKKDKKLAVFFIAYLVESEKIENFLLEPLLSKEIPWANTSIKNEIPLNGPEEVVNLKNILANLLLGKVYVYIEQEQTAIAYMLSKKEKRSLQQSETESLVLGPKIGFTESMVTNLNIVRWNIRSEDLVLERFMLGKREPREVRIIYLHSIANSDDVQTMRQRLTELDIDFVEDSAILMQYIEDSSSTIFPQFLSTELPDRFSYSINKGKIGVLVENSPTAIIAPTSFFSYFESTEDLYMRWNVGTFLRGLRFISFLLSTLLTPMYVAAATFHYEIIPPTLLVNLGLSRAAVPFPPILEALFLELMIELLRESGARLPTKVGQTIGIVGGVVVGTAAVQAGITSNVLIIFVALSALASFTAPNYLMGTTARIIRFPMIILAGFLGIIGILFGACFLVIHLLKLTSLGRPYLSPIYPLEMKDFNKVLFRLPNQFQYKRFKSYRPKDLIRYPKQKAKKKKDIDE
ncbi:spore germination protein [Oceanobacillus piezotolerans]|uniref:Spore germination protein n=1 Tax=Oceanobacillus piezotolerans TaxID=2448030 RepID=A0A498D5H3_9BACI|nr:spore germination protein [Oceanobacillus piezotolerans]RLL44968.1 spore germination protein [Oceanobacillus piezotolerans]